MIPREKEILKDTWASKNYCDVYRKYIDPAFLDGVLWADEHISDETLDKIVNLTLNWNHNIEEFSNAVDYRESAVRFIREHWND